MTMAKKKLEEWEVKELADRKAACRMINVGGGRGWRTPEELTEKETELAMAHIDKISHTSDPIEWLDDDQVARRERIECAVAMADGAESYTAYIRTWLEESGEELYI